jgi:hypothetical protein
MKKTAKILWEQLGFEPTVSLMDWSYGNVVKRFKELFALVWFYIMPHIYEISTNVILPM